MQTDYSQAPEVVSRRTVSEKLLTFARYSMPHAEHPERNEDAILIERARGLAAVFDGVGGEAYGSVASRTAARVVRTRWRKALAAVQQTPGLLSTELEVDIPALLQEVIESARKGIQAQGKSVLQKDGSKTFVCGETTLALVVFCIDSAHEGYLLHYAHVGDSRVYLLPQEKTLQRLTSDDGYAALQIGKKLLSEEDAQRIDQAILTEELSEEDRVIFGKRNGITQSLGKKEIVIHLGCATVFPGDRVLLSTDGIHDNLTNLEIEAVLRHSARTTAARVLVQRASERSQQEHLRAKKDDMTAIVITV